MYRDHVASVEHGRGRRVGVMMHRTMTPKDALPDELR